MMDIQLVSMLLLIHPAIHTTMIISLTSLSSLYFPVAATVVHVVATLPRRRVFSREVGGTPTAIAWVTTESSYLVSFNLIQMAKEGLSALCASQLFGTYTSFV